MAFQFKSVTAILLFLLGIGVLSQAAQPEQAGPQTVQRERTPPQELIKYIEEAKRLGVADAKIKKEALTVGWPTAVVDEALAIVKSGKDLQLQRRAPNAPPEANNVPAPPEIPVEAPVLIPAKSQVPAVELPPAAVGNPVPAISAGQREVPDDYVIGAGDTLQISVWKEPEVSVPSVVVRPDGRITVPLIKEVGVGRLTPLQAEKVITEALAKYLPDANVTVVVAAMNSKKVYLIGAVKKEGPLSYTYGMSVMQALSEAGGLTDYARRKKIYILRSENGREYRLDFNYDEVLRGERMDQNVVLLAGDTVVIPN